MIKSQSVLITGGAGFIGSNLTEFFLSQGNRVTIFDNLSRPGGGAEKNIKALLEKYRNNPSLKFIKGDIRDFDELSQVIKDIDIVLHVAAQTAMTTSIENPVADFETNARGTFNVLEAARRANSDPIIIYTSTNKVYGDLTKKQVKLVEKETRWDFAEDAFVGGVDENYPLDYEGPYGCSKGIGDAYCLDYARTFGLKTVVFRMSGIYGVGQHPTEDQGWVAWFIRRATEAKPVTIYGDGKQVRDILYIEDLINAFDKAIAKIDKTRGEAYNIGGGRENSISVLELLDLMERKLGIKSPKITFDSWRRADQKVYISNTSRAKGDFGWSPQTSKEKGITKLYNWIKKELDSPQ